MTDKTGAEITAACATAFRDLSTREVLKVAADYLETRPPETHFACIEIEGDAQPMFAHFNPPLGVLPGETIHEAHARQPWVMVGILPEPLVPAGVPVLMEAPEADESQLSPALLKQLAPLVWQHILRYGFAPVPFNPATWRGASPA